MLKIILKGISILLIASSAAIAQQVSESDFSLRTLGSSLEQPMAMEVDPAGNIFIIGRCGRFYVWSPNTQAVQQTSSVNVRCDLELGLIGLTLDPNYINNRWIYLHYNPRNSSKQRVSRFRVNQNNSLNMGSEIVMLEFPVQTAQCCHQGGDLEFGPAGNLFISVGDNVNPFASNGYTPIDERPGRAPWDAQGTSSNTNDLRGKILRIRPNNNGTYSIPNGNLFNADALHRPEIYVMGNRNPFRMTIDDQTGYLYWGEIGPDANSPSSVRGPAGYDEINQARQAGNYGFPYVTGFNEPYRDYNFNNGNRGSFFNINRPINNSPNNTGATVLPATKPAWLRYPHQAMMAGVVYHYNSGLDNEQRLPSYFDNRLLFWNFNNSDIYSVEMDENHNNPNASVFFDQLTNGRSLIDMTLDNQDRMLVLGYNRNFNGQLYRIEFNGQHDTPNRDPVVVTEVAPTQGQLPLNVFFSAENTISPDGDTLSYSWDFTTDGTIDSIGPVANHVYTAVGQYNAQLRVSNSQGNDVVRNFTILAGLSAPTVEVTSPRNGSFFEYGDVIDWQVSVDNGNLANDVDCSEVTVELSLGHVTGATMHEHGLAVSTGCSGSFETLPEGGHDDADVYLVLNASYTNSDGIPGNDSIELRPRLREAEHWTETNGVIAEVTTDIGGGHSAAFINNGDWLMFRDMNLINVDEIHIRVASATAGGTIEAHIGGVFGHVVGSVDVQRTGGWQVWETLTMTIDPANRNFGATDLYFTFSGSSNFLFNINWFEFSGDTTDNSTLVVPPPQSDDPTPSPTGVTQRIEAEDFSAQTGILVLANTAGDGENVGYIQNGDSTDYFFNVPDSGTYNVSFNAATLINGGTITLTQGGVALASVDVPLTGGWQNWVTLETTANLNAGPATYRLEYSGGNGFLFNIDWFEISAVGGATNEPNNTDPVTVVPNSEPVDQTTVPAGSDTLDDSVPSTEVTLRIEAEDFSTQAGILVLANTAGDGENVGYIQNGDSTDYFFNVPDSGTYNVSFNAATLINGGTITLTQGSVALASVDVPLTGGWQNWVTLETTATLNAGPATYRLEYSGGNGFLFNIDWFEISAVDSVSDGTTQSPIDSASAPAIARIEAEQFAAQSGIQSEVTSDVGGGENIGYINNGDSSDYIINVTNNGTYSVSFRVASLLFGGTITLTQGNVVLASVDVPVTGGWQNWVTVETTAILTAGPATYRLEYSGSGRHLFNVNWFELTAVDS